MARYKVSSFVGGQNATLTSTEASNPQQAARFQSTQYLENLDAQIEQGTFGNFENLSFEQIQNAVPTDWRQHALSYVQATLHSLSDQEREAFIGDKVLNASGIGGVYNGTVDADNRRSFINYGGLFESVHEGTQILDAVAYDRLDAMTYQADPEFYRKALSLYAYASTKQWVTTPVEPVVKESNNAKQLIAESQGMFTLNQPKIISGQVNTNENAINLNESVSSRTQDSIEDISNHAVTTVKPLSEYTDDLKDVLSNRDMQVLASLDTDQLLANDQAISDFKMLVQELHGKGYIFTIEKAFGDDGLSVQVKEGASQFSLTGLTLPKVSDVLTPDLVGVTEKYNPEYANTLSNTLKSGGVVSKQLLDNPVFKFAASNKILVKGAEMGNVFLNGSRYDNTLNIHAMQFDNLSDGDDVKKKISKTLSTPYTDAMESNHLTPNKELYKEASVLGTIQVANAQRFNMDPRVSNYAMFGKETITRSSSSYDRDAVVYAHANQLLPADERVRRALDIAEGLVGASGITRGGIQEVIDTSLANIPEGNLGSWAKSSDRIVNGKYGKKRHSELRLHTRGDLSYINKYNFDKYIANGGDAETFMSAYSATHDGQTFEMENSGFDGHRVGHLLRSASGSGFVMRERLPQFETMNINETIDAANEMIKAENHEIYVNAGIDEMVEDFVIPDDLRSQITPLIEHVSAQDGYKGLDAQSLLDHGVKLSQLKTFFVDQVDHNNVSQDVDNPELFRGIAFDSFVGLDTMKVELKNGLAGHRFDRVKSYDELGEIQRYTVEKTITQLLKSGVVLRSNWNDNNGEPLTFNNIEDVDTKRLVDMFYAKDANGTIYFDSDNVLHWSGQTMTDDSVVLAPSVDSLGKLTAEVNNQNAFVRLHNVSGVVGQIFDYSDDPELSKAIKVDRLGAEPYYYVPGYTATAVPDPSNKVPLGDRLRFHGYEAAVEKVIGVSINSQLYNTKVQSLSGVDAGRPLYNGDLYGTKISQETAQREDLGNIVEQLSRRVMFSDSVVNLNPENDENGLPGAFTPEQSGATQLRKKLEEYGVSDDEITARTAKISNSLVEHNLPTFVGLLDPSATSDGGKIGKIRYLAEGVEIGDKGIVTKRSSFEDTIIDGGASMSVAHNQLDVGGEADARDRQMMAAQATSHAFSIQKDVTVGMLTYRGYTFEDGIGVSKRYVDDFKARTGRDLKVGDKLSDNHGNKGVITGIIAPDDADGLFFKQNPEVDMIVSPHSPIGRFNMGSILEQQLNEKGFKPLYDQDGSEMGKVGRLTMLELDAKVDHKTQLYTDAEKAAEENIDTNLVSTNIGRKFGHQQVWVADSLGLHETMKEIFGSEEHTKSMSDFRHYLNAVGVDFDSKGELSVSTGSPREVVNENGEKQIVGRTDVNVVDLNDPMFTSTDPEVQAKARKQLDLSNFVNGGYVILPHNIDTALVPFIGEPDNRERLSDRFYVLPARLRKPSTSTAGEVISSRLEKQYTAILNNLGDLPMQKERSEALKPVMELIGESVNSGNVNGKKINGKAVDEDPVLRAQIEKAIENVDGLSAMQKVEVDGVETMQPHNGRNLLSNIRGLNTRTKKALDITASNSGSSNSIGSIISNIRSVQRDIITDYLGDSDNRRSVKHSIIKNKITGTRLTMNDVPSATALVTGNAHLPLDTIAMSHSMMKSLKIKEGDPVMLWRDPVLHDGSMRAFKVVADDSYIGIGINPLVTESFGMDFDGDTVAIAAPQTQVAKEELLRKGTVWQNAFDTTFKDQLALNLGMDNVLATKNAWLAGAWPDAKTRQRVEAAVLKDRGLTYYPEVEGQKLTAEQEVSNSKVWKARLERTLGDYIKEGKYYMVNRYSNDILGGRYVDENGKNIDFSYAAGYINPENAQTVNDTLKDIIYSGAKGKVKAKPMYNKNGNRALDEHGVAIQVATSDNLNTVNDYLARGVELTRLKNAAREAGGIAKLPKADRDRFVQIRNSKSIDDANVAAAQVGKQMLTGQAGAKSLKLTALTYDLEGGLSYATELTEPLTQAVLQIKHSADLLPRLVTMLNDYESMMSAGGLTREKFGDWFKTNYDGLADISPEIVNGVFDRMSMPEDVYHDYESYKTNLKNKGIVGKEQAQKLSDKFAELMDNAPTPDENTVFVTQPINRAIEHNASTLSQASINGVGAIFDAAKAGGNLFLSKEQKANIAEKTNVKYKEGTVTSEIIGSGVDIAGADGNAEEMRQVRENRRDKTVESIAAFENMKAVNQQQLDAKEIDLDRFNKVNYYAKVNLRQLNKSLKEADKLLGRVDRFEASREGMDKATVSDFDALKAAKASDLAYESAIKTAREKVEPTKESFTNRGNDSVAVDNRVRNTAYDVPDDVFASDDHNTSSYGDYNNVDVRSSFDDNNQAVMPDNMEHYVDPRDFDYFESVNDNTGVVESEDSQAVMPDNMDHPGLVAGGFVQNFASNEYDGSSDAGIVESEDSQAVMPDSMDHSYLSVDDVDFVDNVTQNTVTQDVVNTPANDTVTQNTVAQDIAKNMVHGGVSQDVVSTENAHVATKPLPELDPNADNTLKIKREFMGVDENGKLAKQKAEVVIERSFDDKVVADNVTRFHDAIRRENTNLNVLEVSPLAHNELGAKLSSKELPVDNNADAMTVAETFEASKLNVGPRNKFDGFEYQGKQYDNEQGALLYDYMYVNALANQPGLADEMMQYDVFSDIDTNPARNRDNVSAASSVTVYKALVESGKLPEALADVNVFAQEVSDIRGVENVGLTPTKVVENNVESTIPTFSAQPTQQDNVEVKSVEPIQMPDEVKLNFAQQNNVQAKSVPTTDVQEPTAQQNNVQAKPVQVTDVQEPTAQQNNVPVEPVQTDDVQFNFTKPKVETKPVQTDDVQEPIAQQNNVPVEPVQTDDVQFNFTKPKVETKPVQKDDVQAKPVQQNNVPVEPVQADDVQFNFTKPKVETKFVPTTDVQFNFTQQNNVQAKPVPITDVQEPIAQQNNVPVEPVQATDVQEPIAQQNNVPVEPVQTDDAPISYDFVNHTTIHAKPIAKVEQPTTPSLFDVAKRMKAEDEQTNKTGVDSTVKNSVTEMTESLAKLDQQYGSVDKLNANKQKSNVVSFDNQNISYSLDKSDGFDL